jgi:hypothetical protein
MSQHQESDGSEGENRLANLLQAAAEDFDDVFEEAEEYRDLHTIFGGEDQESDDDDPDADSEYVEELDEDEDDEEDELEFHGRVKSLEHRNPSH